MICLLWYTKRVVKKCSSEQEELQMVSYDIVKDSISDTEAMWDVIKYNQASNSWYWRHSFDTKEEASRYLKKLKYEQEYAAKHKAM